MPDQQLQDMREFGCPPPLLAFLAELPEQTPFFAMPSGGKGEFWIIKANADCEGALYLDRSALLIALDPSDARVLVDVTGSRVEENNPTTWRVLVTPAQAVDPQHRDRYLAAAASSLARSLSRPGKAESETRDRMYAPLGPVCPVCQEELPLTGSCDTHGRPA